LLLAACGPATPVQVEGPTELGIPEVVRPPDQRDYSDVAGVYDVNAVVTTFDPAWGYDLTGYRYTAVVTLAGSEPPGLAGDFTEMWLVGPSGDSLEGPDAGTVDSRTDADANDAIFLRRTLPTGDFTLHLSPSTVTRGFLAGGFLAGGHIVGTFEAKRR